MDFVDASGTRYQLTETTVASASVPAKKPVWPWIVGGLTLAGGLVWMASSTPRKANPVSPELDALIEEARDPNTSNDRLLELQKHPEKVVRHALLDNPNVLSTNEDGKLNTSLMILLAREFPEEVAEHPAFVLHALIEPNKKILSVVFEVVRRTKDVSLIQQMMTLYGHVEWLIRCAVAKNPNTSICLLSCMGKESTEPRWKVRENVARNPNTPLEILRILGNPATESDLLVREAAAEALAARGLS